MIMLSILCNGEDNFHIGIKSNGILFSEIRRGMKYQFVVASFEHLVL
jgi:hypothetical protein